MIQVPDIIFVQDSDKRPLMPTKRKRHVRMMLSRGEASIVEYVPFTIRLNRPSGHFTTPLCFGTDPGRTNVGASVVSESLEELFRAVLKTRNEEIPELMANRKKHRMASRHGERKRRQRRARKFGTMIAAGMRMRKLPGCKKAIICKIIRNSESKFIHRTRKKGWLTPTANQLVQTHVSLLKTVCKYLPVTDISLEVNKFAFMELEDPSCTGLDFQNGPLKGFTDIPSALYKLQNGKCLLCGKRHGKDALHDHHLIPRSEGGSDTIGNRALICLKCHDKVHTDPEAKKRLGEKKKGISKKYGGTSVLNQAIPFIAKEYMALFGPEHTHFTTGAHTCRVRRENGIVKDVKANPCHDVDAYIIACAGFNRDPEDIPETYLYSMGQYRRHNRAIIDHQKERAYQVATGEYTKAGKPKYKTVAANRKPRTGQADDVNQDGKPKADKEEHLPALSEWYAKRCREIGKLAAQKERSKLRVVPSKRAYNDRTRLLPGAEYWYQGQRYIFHGRCSKIYVYPAGGSIKDKVLLSKCHVTKKNRGIVFIS